MTEVLQPKKKFKTDALDRIPGLIFTISTPSKLKQSSNSVLALLDAVKVDPNEVDHPRILTSNAGSVSDEISRELQELSKSSKLYKFSSELSRGMGLISFSKELVPSEFVYRLLKNNCPASPPMFVSRLIPVDVVCAPNIQSFESVVVPAIHKKFKEFSEDVSWKVIFDRHGLTNLTKDKAIELAQGVIDDRHEVSIFEPDIVIMIQITQSMCGVGFLKEYDQLCEYNLRKLILNRSKTNS
jgi:hypothetical protein